MTIFRVPLCWLPIIWQFYLTFSSLIMVLTKNYGISHRSPKKAGRQLKGNADTRRTFYSGGKAKFLANGQWQLGSISIIHIFLIYYHTAQINTALASRGLCYFSCLQMFENHPFWRAKGSGLNRNLFMDIFCWIELYHFW